MRHFYMSATVRAAAIDLVRFQFSASFTRFASITGFFILITPQHSASRITALCRHTEIFG